MIKKELSNLSDIIKYVNDRNTTIDRAKMLASVSVTAIILYSPDISASASTGCTLAGMSIPPLIKNFFDKFNDKTREEKAINTLERCQFADFILSRLAVAHVVRNNLRGKDRIFADWKISLIAEEDKTRITKIDEEREEKFINNFLNKDYDKEAYWDDLLSAIIKVIDLKDEEELTFRKKMKEEISKAYEAFKDHVICSSKYFEIYKKDCDQAEIVKQFNKLTKFLKIYKKMYRTIDEVDEWLKTSTNPSIGLDFFNYEETSFVDQFTKQLSKNVIYVKGKTREEVLMYILHIIKNIVKTRKNDTYIVDTIEHWNQLKGNCKGKILIPNFNAAIVDVIPENTCVIAFSEEDYIGNKKPIELNKRILSNMNNMLYRECDDLDLTNAIVNKTNGLYASFKRIVFEGKTGKPKWEEHAGQHLVPALLIGKWTEKGQIEEQDPSGDIEAVSKVAGRDYKEYVQSLKGISGGEDPFFLKYRGYEGKTYKLANVEEAWEILFKYISSENISAFRELTIEVLTEVSPKFNMPVEKHFMAGILAEQPKYSNTIKVGIVRTLTMLANMENIENNFGIQSTQKYVDGIVKEILDQVDSSKKWFAISEFIEDLVEASPEVVLDTLKRETSNQKSLIWNLFEKQSNSWFSGVNYYTHVLWALEKLLCFKNYAIPAVKVLAKLAERRIEYKISNSPLSTMYRALCAWLHDINASIEDKIKVTEYIVKKSEIGWELLEYLLPDRSLSTSMSITKPRYRKYKNEYYLKSNEQILDTYKKYTEIAIEQAGNDLTKWKVLFKKFFFFELGLEEKVITGVVDAINSCDSDTQKYRLKEQFRDLIHRHRFFKNSDWALEEEYIARIENEIFNEIIFDNDIFEYLYLFKTNRPPLIHPKPYDKNDHNYEEERRKVSELRRNAIIKISKDPNLDILKLIEHLTNESEYGSGLTEIGEVIAREFHKFDIDYSFIDSMIELNQETVIRAYVDAIYREKGLVVIEKVVNRYKDNIGLSISILQLANIDKEFMYSLENYESDIVQKYWESHWMIRNISDDKEILEQVWSNLLEYRNYRSAIDMLHYRLDEDIEKHIQLLEKILVDRGEYRVNNNDRYHIKKSFEKIYQLNDLGAEVSQRIFNLEWGYLEVLVDDIKPKYLTKELKRNPEFLSELIRYAYKNSDEVKDAVETDEARKFLANQSFNILLKLKFCPCVDDNGEILVDELKSWTERFLGIVDKNKQSKIGRQILGECFSKAPSDKDGYFPHKAVREVFEKNYSDDLQRGFCTGIVNSRGVYHLTNGDGEKDIAQRYKSYSDETRIEYPQMSQTLKKLADYYLMVSERERERATYGL
ncbi:hypothetical protein [Crassaminicella profunda]|uniref:hypothetical protein n=1 Tax=Crassaminicella profunda TaxID=1286698 RepID=UPI001CA7145E|nr:hypothetical protein [Crassaminicella profunda]QZY53777.1 hypothetical protein K7H06_11980 [Crassaminicella profunda]